MHVGKVNAKVDLRYSQPKWQLYHEILKTSSNKIIITSLTVSTSCRAPTRVFSRNVVWGGDCFCGKRKCEKHPAGCLNLLLFEGEI